MLPIAKVTHSHLLMVDISSGALNVRSMNNDRSGLGTLLARSPALFSYKGLTVIQSYVCILFNGRNGLQQSAVIRKIGVRLTLFRVVAPIYSSTYTGHNVGN